MAALDLHSGQIMANVEARHRSVEFISLLCRPDEHYAAEALIRVVLNNHSAHVSKETVAYLATRPEAGSSSSIKMHSESGTASRAVPGNN